MGYNGDNAEPSFKPCPFCSDGGDPDLNGKDEYWIMSCLSCGVQTTFDFNSDDEDDIARAEKEAVAFWNNRPRE